MKPNKSPGTTVHHARSTHRPGGRPTSIIQDVARCSSRRSSVRNRILLVDDDPTVRDSLKDVLVSEGYAVIPAENGQQALDLAKNASVDVVLLDLNMPVKNGWDTFERFTAEHPTVPIIIITARANQLFTAVGAGAGALLEKPLDIPTLLQAIARLLAMPPSAHLERLVGRKAEFYYSAGQVYDEETPRNPGERATSNGRT